MFIVCPPGRPSEDPAGPLEGLVDVGADILRADHPVDIRPLEHVAHPLVDAREDHLYALGLGEADEALEVVQARRVHEGHLAHPDDADAGLVAHALHDAVELVGDAEEEGAVDLVDLHATWDGEALLPRLARLVLLRQVDHVGGDGDARRLGHAAHEEEHGDQEADLDGDRQVEDDRQQEGDEQDGDVALRVLHQRPEGAPLAHVVRDDDEHAGQAGHRDVSRQRPEEEEDEQQHAGVHDAGDRAAATVVDVGHRAGDGAGDGDAAEDRDDDVGRALGDQLGVRVVAVADDAVGHGGREQRLDGAQHGDREGRRDEQVDRLHVEGQPLGPRQRGVDREAVANGLDRGDAPVLAQEVGDDGHEDDGDQRPGDLAGQPGREGDDRDTGDADPQRPGVHGGEGARVGDPFRDEIRRHLRHREAEEVFHLGGEDRHGDTAREADDDRVGDELDDRPEPQGAHQEQYPAGQDGGDGQPLDAEVLDDAVDDHDEGARGPSDLHLAAAQQGDDKAADDGGDQAFFRTHARGDTKRDGEGQGDDADNDARHQVSHELFLRIVSQLSEKFGLKHKHVTHFFLAVSLTARR